MSEKDIGRSSGRTSGADTGQKAGQNTGKVPGKVGYGRRGRPTERPRKLVFQLRMDEEESRLLDLISYSTEDSKSNVIRKALKMYASVKKDSY